MNAPKKVLADAERFQCRASDDTEKFELELTCRECGQWLTDIQPGDSLATLISLANGHTCELQAEPEKGWPTTP